MMFLFKKNDKPTLEKVEFREESKDHFNALIGFINAITAVFPQLTKGINLNKSVVPDNHLGAAHRVVHPALKGGLIDAHDSVNKLGNLAIKLKDSTEKFEQVNRKPTSAEQLAHQKALDDLERNAIIAQKQVAVGDTILKGTQQSLLIKQAQIAEQLADNYLVDVTTEGKLQQAEKAMAATIGIKTQKLKHEVESTNDLEYLAKLDVSDPLTANERKEFGELKAEGVTEQDLSVLDAVKQINAPTVPNATNDKVNPAPSQDEKVTEMPPDTQPKPQQTINKTFIGSPMFVAHNDIEQETHVSGVEFRRNKLDVFYNAFEGEYNCSPQLYIKRVEDKGEKIYDDAMPKDAEAIQHQKRKPNAHALSWAKISLIAFLLIDSYGIYNFAKLAGLSFGLSVLLGFAALFVFAKQGKLLGSLLKEYFDTNRPISKWTRLTKSILGFTVGLGVCMIVCLGLFNETQLKLDNYKIEVSDIGKEISNTNKAIDKAELKGEDTAKLEASLSELNAQKTTVRTKIAAIENGWLFGYIGYFAFITLSLCSLLCAGFAHAHYERVKLKLVTWKEFLKDLENFQIEKSHFDQIIEFCKGIIPQYKQVCYHEGRKRYAQTRLYGGHEPDMKSNNVSVQSGLRYEPSSNGSKKPINHTK